MARKKVLAVAHDKGGLNLLAPLLKAWKGHAGIEASFASTPAVCADMCVRVPEVVLAPWTDKLTEQVCASRAMLSTIICEKLPGYDAVVCGTSANAVLERQTLRDAHTCGVPSISFCDMWCAYLVRYTDGPEWCAPEVLWTLDKRMSDEAAAIAWPDRPQIEAVGSPFFQELAELPAIQPSENAAIRFISEPALRYFPECRVSEYEIAHHLIRTARSAGIQRRIVIRTHPDDAIETWRRLAWEYREQNVELDVRPMSACLQDTHQAVGISSMLLLEMRLRRIPAAYIHPDGSDPAYFCLPFEDFQIRALRTGEQLVQWLKNPTDGMAARINPPHKTAVSNATESLLKLVNR